MSFVDQNMIYAIVVMLFGSSFISICAYYLSKMQHKYNSSIISIIYIIFIMSLLGVFAYHKLKCKKVTIQSFLIFLNIILKFTGIWILYILYLEYFKKEIKWYMIIFFIFLQAYVNITVMSGVNIEMEHISKNLKCKG